MLKRLFIIASCVILSLSVHSQTPDYIFHNIGERQGLAANFCYRILKDSRGLLWVGTIDGLCRYDGSHFRIFKSSKDSSVFFNNEILDLCEDKQGNIWGSTRSGIFCYLVIQDKFISYTPPTYEAARSVYNILCDKRGDIWATSEWTIVKLNKNINRFEEVGPLTRNYDSLKYYSVRQNGLCEDPSGKGLWLATRSGLFFYNTVEKKFYGNHNMPNDSLFVRHSVAALSPAPGGYFWFFENDTKTIKAFDPVNHKILHRINVNAQIPDAIGQTLYEDSNGLLWFSTWNYRSVVIDYKKKQFVYLSYKEDNPLSIAGNAFWDVWEDRDKTLWLATTGGISKCNYSKNVYSILSIAEVVPEFKNRRLGAFAFDPNDRSWWIASENNNAPASVIHYYPQSGKYKYFDFSKSIKNSYGQQATDVFCINFIDGMPYACTHTGVWLLDEKTGFVLPFEKKFENGKSVAYNYVVENGDDLFFSANSCIIKWNKKTSLITRIKADVDSVPDGQRLKYEKIFFDRNDRPWFFPAFGWIATFDKTGQVRLKYYIKNKAKEQVGYITSIADDKQGDLWLVSRSVGLYKYNIANEEMTLYDQSDEISGFILQAMPDSKGHIWTAAMNKFSVFNPKTRSISHFSIPLYENIFDYGNALLQDSNGYMLATMHRDIVIFRPDRLKLSPVLQPPLLSMINIAGKERQISTETDLKLEPDENSLEFYFGSLMSNEIFPYSLEYKLDGFNKEWIQASNDNPAIYNNLNSGKYTFRIRAVARDRSWQSPERTISLTIRTPFYKAIWFWCLITFLVITTIVLFYHFRMRKQKEILSLQAKAQELEKEKTMVMYENLKQQLNPHFLFNSLTSLSGLIETDQQVAGTFLEQMSGIYRYILKNGNSETVTVKDEIEFVKLYINLQQTRFKSGLQVLINVPNEYLQYHIAPVTLQNMIENAIKHNIIDAVSPLIIEIVVEDKYLVAKNNLQKKAQVETSNKKGLSQFVSLYQYLSDLPVIIEESDKEFKIKIPLI